ncbi:MAG: tetratricopeptide repeat protein [Planctomycetia bacterium]
MCPRVSVMCRRGAVVLAAVTAAAGAVAGDPQPTPKVGAADVAAMVDRIAALRAGGEYARAIEAGRSAVAVAEKAVGREDRHVTAAKHALAAAYLEVDDTSAAAPLLREVVASLEQGEPVDTTTLSYAVGDLAQTCENDEEAESHYRRALGLAEKAAGAEHRVTAHALNNLGWFLYEQGRFDEADPFMRRALHIRERRLGPADPSTMQSLCMLGVIAEASGDVTVAESLVRRSLDMRRLALPKGHPDVGESCERLARILLGQGKERVDEAVTLAAESFDIYRRVYGPTAMKTLGVMRLRARAASLLARRTEAERLHQELVAKTEALSGEHPRFLAAVLGDFGEHMLHSGRPENAVGLYRRAVAALRKAPGNDERDSFIMRQRLAEALYANGRIEDAVAEGRSVVAFFEPADGEPRPESASALHLLAKYLLGGGGMEEARPMLRRSADRFEKSAGRGSREALEALHLLAVTYLLTDELEEAERVVDEGLVRAAREDDVRHVSVARDLLALRARTYRKTGRAKKAEEAEAVEKRAGAVERPR